MSSSADATDLDGAVERLAHEFAGVFARETVAESVRDSAERLGAVRVTTYRGLLAYRFARERLRAAAHASGALPLHVTQVLLVCTHNAGRSQLAAALLAHLGGDRVVVRSAGTAPAEDLHDHVREVLAEIGVDASNAFPKPLTDEVVAASDVVVTMGCGDACPVVPGRRYLDWDLPDPAGRDRDGVRRVRDEVAGRVRDLVGQL